MLGVWQRFGEGEPPVNGEAIVFIRQVSLQPIDILEGLPRHELVPAIHRYGMLYEQSGSSYGIPYGALWTSLPALEDQAGVPEVGDLTRRPFTLGR